MRLFPKKEFTIETDYTKQEVINKIADATLLKSDEFKLRVFNDGKHFRGEVYEDGFEVRPMGMMYGHRAYRPNIAGSVEQSGDKTVISGTMETPKLVAILFLIMVSVFFIFSFVYVDMVGFFIPAVLFVSLINYAVIWISFGTYFKWSLNALRQTVGAGYDDDLQGISKKHRS